MVSRRIAEEVGVYDLTRRLAQFKAKSEPVKLGGLMSSLACDRLGRRP